MTANQSNAQRNSRATKAMFVALALLATLFTAVSPASAAFGGGDGGFLHSYSTFTDSNGLSDATIVFSQDQTLGPVDSFSVVVTPVQGGSQELPNLVFGTGDANSVYTLDLEPRQPGAYTLEIESVRGGVRGTVSYDLILPSAPQIAEAGPWIDDSIYVRWHAPEYGEVSSYSIEVSDLLNSFSLTVPGDQTSTIIEGLKFPAAEHFITVRAHFDGNPALDLAPTVAKTSVVSGDRNPNNVSNVTFQLLTPTSVRVNWIEDSTPKPFTTPTESVTVELVAGPNQVVSQTVNAGLGTATLTGLDLDSVYSLSLRVKNKSNATVLVDMGRIQTGSSVVADTVKPAIVINAPSTVSRYGSTAKVSFTCTDNVAISTCGGSHTNGQAISTKTVGAQTITVNASDAAGNTQTASSTVTVSWAFTGQFAGISGNKATIARFYAATFGRLPDQGGYDFWTARLDTEPNGLAAAAQFFATSP